MWQNIQEASTNKFLLLVTSIRWFTDLLFYIIQNQLFLFFLYGIICFEVWDRNGSLFMVTSANILSHLWLVLLPFSPPFMAIFYVFLYSKIDQGLHNILIWYKTHSDQFKQSHKVLQYLNDSTSYVLPTISSHA